MTARHTGAREATAVLVRGEGEVSDEVLAYVRAKVDAVVSRAGLPAITGEVRVAKAAAHHAEHPWSAVADVRVGSAVVVVQAREATGQEVADRLQDGCAGRWITWPTGEASTTGRSPRRGAAASRLAASSGTTPGSPARARRDPTGTKAAARRSTPPAGGPDALRTALC
ncbi:hypothetical protein ACFYO0_40875 [Streptomyces sp. NPDC006365]|uniref:hypothetical protein n=1 Tax=Streptomyces sp. NPDC006365 TaxID=3364744 RepID=UPI003678E8F5